MPTDRIDEHEAADDVPAVDLSALDPTKDERAFDRRVDGVMDAARFELARRKRHVRFVAGPSRWGRVAWPAAAAVVLASLAVLRTSDPVLAAASEVTIEEEMALAFGVPEALAIWVGETDSPVLSEILLGWEQEE